MAGLTIFMVGASRTGADLAAIAGPPSTAAFAALHQMRSYLWIAVWIGVVSWLCMGLPALGLRSVLAQRSALATAAVSFFYLGLVAGTLHFGPDAIYWTLIPDRAMAALGPNQDFYLNLSTFLRDLSLFFEKVWGLARGTSMLLFTLALAAAFGWRRGIVWVSAIGGLEFLYRVPTTLANAPLGFVSDLFYVVWLLGVSIWLVVGGQADRQSAGTSDLEVTR